MKELTLSEIWIYPIKSLGGIRLNTAKVFEKGLALDRRWMLIDEHEGFMTQRFFPKMALLKVTVDGNNIVVTDHDPKAAKASISFEIDQVPVGPQITTKVWDDTVEVIELDPALSEWFSQRLDKKSQLVAFPEKNSRPVDAKYKINDEHVSLADAYPFLIIGQSSLDDLNSRMNEALPMNRFRPNFVFTGGEPFEEDKWREFTIGQNKFAGVKPCARCVLTTINQDTAEKGIEPLVALSKYRKNENKILFGQNVIAIDHKTVSVGDKITVA